MLVVQVLTAVLALSCYCDCSAYGQNVLYIDTSSSSSPRNVFSTLKSEPPTTPAACQGFQCSDGLTCLDDASGQCDGWADCLDFSDELNCPQPHTSGPEPCLAGEFQCKIDKTCIAITQRCDGREHCQDGSDEIGCPCAKDEWKCNFGSFKQQHVETDEKKDAKQHHDHHKAAVAQKKSQVVVRANLKQLEPNHKKHNNNNNHKSNHSKKNHKKVPAVLKINDDDEDLMLGDGSAEDGEIILPSPISPGGAGMGTRQMYRCSLLVQEPYNEKLGDRDSSDFSEMANRFNIAVDYLYLHVSGTQTTNVQTFERTSQRQLTKVNFDIESQDFDDVKVTESTLCSAVQNGVIGSFYVESDEGFTFRVVEGSAISPLPSPPEYPDDCEIQCKSDGQCITLEQRCNGFDDCEDGSDEEGCPPDLFPQPGDSDSAPEELDCRGDIKTKCRVPNGLSYSEEPQCDGIVNCPECDDEEDCYGCSVAWTNTNRPAPTTTTTTTTITTTTTTPEPPPVGCQEDEFSCDGRCLPFSVFCDGQADCLDGEDEIDCLVTGLTPPCPWSNSFRCGDGSCIDASTQRCNGVAECADSSDEADCVIHDMMTTVTINIGAGQNLISCNSASDPTLAIVCGVVFPILALAIIFSVVLIRKSQGYVYVRYVKKSRLLSIFSFADSLFWLQPQIFIRHSVI
ncbi:sortilin-related receptor-like [Daphnia pulicaria]|uniref:sortilin-related receptor-like n=1 Tax=Daphnia pulicaria TaxID=35523 RepID=UPI001EECE189|nr:sortilin-related receptor-like [Daphnia pulicaria]